MSFKTGSVHSASSHVQARVAAQYTGQSEPLRALPPPQKVETASDSLSKFQKKSSTLDKEDAASGSGQNSQRALTSYDDRRSLQPASLNETQSFNIGFLAQHIAQEQIGRGLHRDPLEETRSAYAERSLYSFDRGDDYQPVDIQA